MKNQVTLSSIKNVVEEVVARVVENKLTDKIKNLATKEELIQFKETILGEIEKSREELTVTKGYGDQLEDHDNRISVLEKTSHIHP